MKSMNSLSLLEQLQAGVRQLIAEATYLKNEDPGYLLEQPGPGKWSVVQVLEHLNSYGCYYLPALEKGLKKEGASKKEFRPGWLGNYFTNLMLPKEGQVKNKMKTPKDHQPAFHADAYPILETFLLQQHTLLELLELAKQKNIGAIRIPISLSRLIRLKAGDTFRFFIAHEQRHFVQVRNTLAAVKGITGKFPAAHRAG